MIISQEDFLAEIEAFLARHKMAASRLGIDAVGDPSFVLKLRNGRKTTLDRADRVMRFMRERDDQVAA